ncbi:hypothetical protein Mgra_00005479 [Meloidogyne graminicola]|uniref:Uncharacterized protein n=1 Tax=Meloidogyne graminicola TaxID=189291 RepID=A0A8S9ZPG6_9BILA|nr:hypothetical protein Mgra_00005479 [Meloidogyne graminicola]
MKLLIIITFLFLIINTILIDAQFLSNSEKQSGTPAIYASHKEHVGNWNPARRRRNFLSQNQSKDKTPAKYIYLN